MRLLLDTHVFIWWRENSLRLSGPAASAIARAEVVYVSVVSAWECIVKVGAGFLRIPEPFESAIPAAGFEPLALTFRQIERLALLPAHP